MSGRLRQTPEISVVLPVRNGVATISTAISSIRAQTLADWELLVVDDGSADDTVAVVESWTQRDPRIRLLRRPAQGLVAALETGCAAARAPFLARMDADDESLPERLALQAAFLDAHPDIGLVGCLVEFGGRRAASGGYALHVDWLNSLVTPEAIALNRFVESPLAHPSVMFRRELRERHGGYREGPFPEDYELWLRWIEAGVRMAKVPRTLLVWNDPPHRLSRTDARYDPEAFYRLKAGYLAHALESIRRARSVWVWGAGRPTRRRAEHLVGHGIRISGYIDIDPKKAGRVLAGRTVVLPESMPGPDTAVVLGYVGKRGARELIRNQLEFRGYQEGTDFWMAA